MKRRGVIRRVVLPSIWVVIGALVAASLVKLAFLDGGAAARGDDPLRPTGEVPAETVAVARGNVSNQLTVEGTIELDPARSSVAPVDGELIHVFVSEGFQVESGAPLYQVRAEKEPAVEPEPAEGTDGPVPPRPAAPAYTYTTVVAPVSGRVSPYAVAVGDPVTKGAAVVSVQPATYKAIGSITPLDRYRLIDRPFHARVTIKGGPRPFVCRDLSVGDAAAAPAITEGGPEGMDGGPEGGGGESATSVTCRVPASVVVFDGLSMSMTIPAGDAKAVLVVPVTAVRGLLARGKVWVIGPGGNPRPRNVRLGITDGKRIEVRSGLKEGDEVLRYVPGSSPQDGREGEMEGEVRYG